MEIMIDYFDRIHELCKDITLQENIKLLTNLLEKAYHNSNRIFFFGNGGSSATASHFCEDLGKGTLIDINESKRFKAVSLTDNVPYIMAWANDEGYDTIFEQQLRNLAEPSDLAIGISGSGNSLNVIKAIQYANKIGMITVAMTGFDGGKLRRMAQYNIHVPVNDMGITECVHAIIAHYIVSYLREKLNGKMSKKPGNSFKL